MSTSKYNLAVEAEDSYRRTQEKKYKIRDIDKQSENRYQWKKFEYGDPAAAPLSYSEVRERTGENIALAYLKGERVLLDALPGTGKTTESIRQCKETNVFVTYLTARRDLYSQAEKIAKEEGLKYKILPSFFEDCPTADGDHGLEAKSKVRSLYRQKMQPAEIHERLNLPCETNGKCRSRKKWDFDSDEVPLLIGAYEHAFVPKVVKDRAVVIDEFPQDRYESRVKEAPEIISTYLSRTNDLPWNDYTSLIENRNTTSPKISGQRDVVGVLETVGKQPYHTLAPLLTKALLEGRDLQNGLEVWFPSLVNLEAIVHDKKNSKMSILQTPDLSDAHAVLALDGTPVPEMWEMLVDNLQHEQVLTDQERKEYIADLQGYTIIQTDSNRRPYSSGTWAKPKKDAGLFEAIAEKHGQKPVLIAPEKTLNRYHAENSLQYVGRFMKSARVLSSQEFEGEELGVSTGSRHYGDNFVKKWAAYAGKSVQRNRNKPNYGPFGDQIAQYMDYQTLQEALRFGRDSAISPTVYVHTSVLPNWVPIAHGPAECKIEKWTGKQQEVIEALRDLGKARSSEIKEHDTVSYQSTRGVRGFLNKLREGGFVVRTDDGTGYIWKMRKDIRTPVHVELP